VTDIERCEAEQREMSAAPAAGEGKAWLVVLGIEDWEREKQLIREEAQA
jgi:hypothetical protein